MEKSMEFKDISALIAIPTFHPKEDLINYEK